MKNLKNLERLQQLHNLITNENTGTPKELANLLQVSQRSVYLLVEQLKDYNANICYSRSRKTYHYCNDFDLKVSISVSVLTNNEVTKIFGGSYFLQSNLFVAS
ncbi:DNA-binding protein [Tenacibaculum dicentrarchi]|nr:DNA-binding protein [Tenacibaculum dicentrarchi]MCD8423825.1 DNA-binding protein [Tenacibaculum dicentrarchi]MCD8441130.1 DNA-binding protein [Tenacibaculum dicentrarchi]MCD8448219.1 DNA-binding protein [Tenacibaculum dicentrarchi]